MKVNKKIFEFITVFCFFIIFNVIATCAQAGYQLEFSTYFGGSQFEHIRDIVTDKEGNIYITGGTESPDYPITAGGYQTIHNPSKSKVGKLFQRLFNNKISPMDVFVTKLDHTGKNIIWSTFIGGPNYDRAYAIEVDSKGYVYVAGRAGAGFPITPGAFQTEFQGGQEATFYGPQDGFVCKLTPDGSALVFCSYFGTSDIDIVRDIAIDQNGDMYLASSRTSGSYPIKVANAFTNSPQGGRDAVIAKIFSDGSRVLWATYLGGSEDEFNENSVRVDNAGFPYFLTVTKSSDAATTNAYDNTYNGGSDFYIVKLNPNNGARIWASYLGGSQDEYVETHNLAVDGQGDVIIASTSLSSDFPTTQGAFDITHNGNGGSGTGARTNYPGDVVVAKLSSDGTQLLASTFIGGSYGESAEGVGVDSQGNIYITGGTFSDNFTVTDDAFQVSKSGSIDGFFAKFSSDLNQLFYSTYFGGSGGEAGRCAHVNSIGSLFLGGEVNSVDFPVQSSIQSHCAGNADGFFAKFTTGNSR